MANHVVTHICPIGDCPVVISQEWAKTEITNEPGFISSAKRQQRQQLRDAHATGEHAAILKKHREANHA